MKRYIPRISPERNGVQFDEKKDGAWVLFDDVKEGFEALSIQSEQYRRDAEAYKQALQIALDMLIKGTDVKN